MQSCRHQYSSPVRLLPAKTNERQHQGGGGSSENTDSHFYLGTASLLVLHRRPSTQDGGNLIGSASRKDSQSQPAVSEGILPTNNPQALIFGPPTPRVVISSGANATDFPLNIDSCMSSVHSGSSLSKKPLALIFVSVLRNLFGVASWLLRCLQKKKKNNRGRCAEDVPPHFAAPSVL